MAHILVSIIPLDIGAILASPMIFALSILLLSQKYYPKVKLAAFFLPAFIVSALVTFLGYNLGQTIVRAPKGMSLHSTTDIIIALVFFFLALCSWIIKEKKIKVDKDAKGKKFFKWFTIGTLMNVSNWNALFLIMTAGKEIGGLEDASQLTQWLLLSVNVFFYTLPLTFPFMLTTFFPVFAKSILSALGLFLKTYSKIIVAGMFFLLGLIFLNRGIGIL